jgi:transposase
VGGFSTKIHLACAGINKPLGFVLSAGAAHDGPIFPKLMAKIFALMKYFNSLIADKAYDSDTIREYLKSQNMEAVIPPRKNRLYKEDYKYNEQLYRERNQIERLLNHIKRRSRRVATRYEKLGVCYAGMVAISCLLCWL